MKTKILLCLFALMTAIHINAQQQVNRAQLQKYFHEASVAKKTGDVQKAINSYEAILQISPEYADAFFELGKLYGQSSQDANSVRKSIINYEKYLQYKTDDSNDKFVNAQLDNLSKIIVDLQMAEIDAKPHPQVAENKMKTESVAVIKNEEIVSPAIIDNSTPIIESVPESIPEIADTKVVVVEDAVVPANSIAAKEDNVFVLEDIPGQSLTLNLSSQEDNEKQLEEPIQLQNTNIPVLVDTPQITIADSVIALPSLSLIDEPLGELSVDPALVGTWVSSEIMNGNREQWVWVIQKKTDGIHLSILDSSYMISQPSLVDFKHDDIEGYAKDGNTIFYLTKNELKEAMVTINDSTYTEMQNLRHRVSFNVLPSISKLQIKSDFSVINTSTNALVSQNSETFELYRADQNYKGFEFVAISENEKETNEKLKVLVDEKRSQIGTSHSAQNELACMYAAGLGVGQNWNQAIRNFTEVANKGYQFALINLGYLYQNGFGVPKDLEKARQYFLKAADGQMGMVDALVYCGDTYLKKTNPSPEDYKMALDYYQKAYTKNSPNAILRLAEMYAEGLGVIQDLGKAKDYYIRAASKQFSEAMVAIAILYRDGRVFEKNLGKCVEYLRKAATFGDGKAQRLYAELLLKGEGIPQNFKESRIRLRNSLIQEDLGLEDFKCSASFKNKVKQLLYP